MCKDLVAFMGLIAWFLATIDTKLGTHVDLTLGKIFVGSTSIPAPPMTRPKDQAAAEKEARLQDVIAAVKDNQYTCHAAAKVFNVPR
jgi:hypothetical protein